MNINMLLQTLVRNSVNINQHPLNLVRTDYISALCISMFYTVISVLSFKTTSRSVMFNSEQTEHKMDLLHLLARVHLSLAFALSV